MQVRAIIYDSTLFSEDLYQRALLLVDPDSAARIKRFYRREDACRTLIGRLLTHTMLKERGISPSLITFGTTDAGKPYITTAGIDPPIAFNISHDNAVVAMAFALGTYGAPSFNLGIDVMKVCLPRRQTLTSFVQTVGEQLTPLELRSLKGISEDESLRRFFWIWTMKEAYTKALGLGLGFDFRRVEYDIESDIVQVDGSIPIGWQFSRFVLNVGQDVYEGIVAQFVGGTSTEIIHESDSHRWLIIDTAVEWVERAMRNLEETSREDP